MRNRLALAAMLAAICGAAYAQAPLPDYNVHVEIQNTTPEKKTNWPVIMTVYKIFGRDLPAQTLNPDGYHVYNEKNDEVEYMIEGIPPYDQQGNNEIVWIIPEIDKGQKLTYRVTNTAKASTKSKHFDIVNNPHNLIANGGFENLGMEGLPAGWEGAAELDKSVKRSGGSSMRLRGTSKREARLAGKIPLHKGSRYYFGVWGKTHEVSRHGIHTSEGAHFVLTGFDSGFRGLWKDERGNVVPESQLSSSAKAAMAESRAGTPFAQCYTRDWAKTHFDVKSYTGWGLPDMCVRAAADTADLTMILDQRPQFVRSPYQPGTWWLDDAVLMEQPEVTVRFDQLLEPHMKDGVFVFARPTSMNLGFEMPGDRRTNEYCSMPYPREEAVKLDRFALKGQRAVFLLGVYHTRPLGSFMVRLKDGALTARDGTRLPLTEIEWLPGFLAPRRFHLLKPHTAPENLQEQQGMPYFLINFQVPRDAKAGKYEGSVELLTGDTVYRSIPITLRVQDMELPILRDISVGAILQSDPLNDETMRQYEKTGFTGVNVGRSIFEFETGKDGKQHVKLEPLGKILQWLTTYGIISRVTLWSDAELGPQWGAGRLAKAVNYNKEDYLAEVKRVEDYAQSHPEWPRLIWMTWDEPQPNGSFEFAKRGQRQQPHGAPHPMMGWPLEAVPNAWNTVDAGFWVWERVLPFYSLANLDEPADYAGPEVYAYTKSRGKEFGFAGAKNDLDERVRYQVGMMLIASGAINFQYWHLTVHGKLMGRVDGKLLRSISMAAMGEGLDDLKIHRLLTDAMEAARRSGDARRVETAKKAEEYFRKIHSIWNADHRKDESYPYLGLATDWGYDQFYQDWQEQMARYAAECKAVTWIE
jgi:hypothetical protein